MISAQFIQTVNFEAIFSEFTTLVGTIVVTTLVGIIYYQKLTATYKLLTQLLFLLLICELVAKFATSTSQSNFLIYHLFLPLHIAYLLLIYNKILTKTLRRAVIALGLIALSITLLTSICWQSTQQFPSIGILSLSSFVISGSLFKFYEMLRTPSSIAILSQSDFWFISGNLFFYGITFFFFGFFKYFQSIGTLPPNWGYTLIWAANFPLYACYGISLYLDSK